MWGLETRNRISMSGGYYRVNRTLCYVVFINKNNWAYSFGANPRQSGENCDYEEDHAGPEKSLKKDDREGYETATTSITTLLTVPESVHKSAPEPPPEPVPESAPESTHAPTREPALEPDTVVPTVEQPVRGPTKSVAFKPTEKRSRGRPPKSRSSNGDSWRTIHGFRRWRSSRIVKPRSEPCWIRRWARNKYRSGTVSSRTGNAWRWGSTWFFIRFGVTKESLGTRLQIEQRSAQSWWVHVNKLYLAISRIRTCSASYLVIRD